MSKFVKGEIAIYRPVTKPVTEAYPGQSAALTGCECEVLSDPVEVGYGRISHRVRFLCSGESGWCQPINLRKRPDDQPFSEWFRNTIITDLTDAPLETTMRNVARNLQKFTEAGHGS